MLLRSTIKSRHHQRPDGRVVRCWNCGAAAIGAEPRHVPWCRHAEPVRALPTHEREAG